MGCHPTARPFPLAGQRHRRQGPRVGAPRQDAAGRAATEGRGGPRRRPQAQGGADNRCPRPEIVMAPVTRIVVCAIPTVSFPCKLLCAVPVLTTLHTGTRPDAPAIMSDAKAYLEAQGLSEAMTQVRRTDSRSARGAQAPRELCHNLRAAVPPAPHPQAVKTIIAERPANAIQRVGELLISMSRKVLLVPYRHAPAHPPRLPAPPPLAQDRTRVIPSFVAAGRHALQFRVGVAGLLHGLPSGLQGDGRAAGRAPR